MGIISTLFWPKKKKETIEDEFMRLRLEYEDDAMAGNLNVYSSEYVQRVNRMTELWRILNAAHREYHMEWATKEMGFKQ